jgi:hypothetical protein
MNKQSILTVLRAYVTGIGLVVLGYVIWQCFKFVHTPGRAGSEIAGMRAVTSAVAPYLLYVCFLLLPWWRCGILIRTLGYALGVPVCAYVVIAFLVVDILYFHEKILFQALLLSGLLAQILRLFLPLPEELRNHDAEICKRYLRRNHGTRIKLVEKFILEVEGEDHDVAIWSENFDPEKQEHLKRLDLVFETWFKKAKSNDAEPLERTTRELHDGNISL